MSLCPRGMHKTGVNVPLKRCRGRKRPPVRRHSALYYFSTSRESPQPMRNVALTKVSVWRLFPSENPREFHLYHREVCERPGSASGRGEGGGHNSGSISRC